MEAPGKVLKVVSILFIVFGVIAVVISLIGLIGDYALLSYGGSTALLQVIPRTILLIVAALELVIGIIGLKKYADPAQAGFFIVTGIILCVISLISLVLGIVNDAFDFTILISFLLPILYIVGGYMNKKAA